MRTLLVLTIALILAGCGQRGSLYFAPTPNPADMPATAPAVEDDTPSESDGP